jgi:hypothetical protein
LRSAPAAARGRRGIRGILRFRGILWLLGSLGLSSASAAATSTDTPSDAARLEARIKAARQVLAEQTTARAAEQAVRHAAGPVGELGERDGADPTPTAASGERSASAAPPTANRLAQWLNEPDWRNWGNWPNWFNQ